MGMDRKKGNNNVQLIPTGMSQLIREAIKGRRTSKVERLGWGVVGCGRSFVNVFISVLRPI